ncbi:hypothetical protein OE749_08290 [Aestuariibacter sp. AA17]|uniref:Uncharacterized protein n=1 Tax=Fluctibacter corallii TaxID=2984329 RepID=A0ABT3A7N6_9ALTE|nr:hypothetical protein [Aestuariibacter sp. AA17]MCV2884693.1 hypothetical protein [Aestuariibacter sp. AA17]
MAEWGEALMFGVALVAFVLGLSSIIMGFMAQPASEQGAMKEKVEYGFFGVSGLVISLLFYIGIVW